MLRPPKVLVITEESYRASHWPRVREAVVAALMGPWNITFSSEELYSVYNICTQRHAGLLYEDLLQVVSIFLQEEAAKLAAVSNEDFFGRLRVHLSGFKRSSEIISTGFTYLERYYLTEKVGAKITQLLVSWQQQLIFHSAVRARFESLLPLLSPSSAGVDPLILSALVKDIYAVDPECAAFNPQLFSLYIPCFTPARSLEHDAKETQQALAQLRAQSAIPSSTVQLKRSFNDAVMT